MSREWQRSEKIAESGRMEKKRGISRTTSGERRHMEGEWG